MKLDLQRHKLLFLLLLADFVFILLHCLYVYTDLLGTSLYSLSRDRGYAEFFQFTKELWIAVLFLILAVRQRRGLYYVFSLLFLYFLVDDSFEFHESFGEFLADIFNLLPALGLRAVDLGELLVSAAFGLLFLLLIVILYLLSDTFSRRVGLNIIALVIILAFFGIAFDMFEIIIAQPEIERIFVILEEGGELLVMSVITWFVHQLDLHQDRLPFSLLPFRQPVDKPADGN